MAKLFYHNTYRTSCLYSDQYQKTDIYLIVASVASVIVMLVCIVIFHLKIKKLIKEIEQTKGVKMSIVAASVLLLSVLGVAICGFMVIKSYGN